MQIKANLSCHLHTHSKLDLLKNISKRAGRIYAVFAQIFSYTACLHYYGRQAILNDNAPLENFWGLKNEDF